MNARTRYVDLEGIERAAKEWAAREGQNGSRWVGSPGGYVRYQTDDGSRGPVYVHGWWSFARLHDAAILDWLTRRLTAFASFDEMLEAPGGYRPTMIIQRGNARDWRWQLLADAYDLGQIKRGDPRRVYRGQTGE